MPRASSGTESKGPPQLRRVLYQRCRRGETEALAILLYRLVDRLYTAASFVAPDEPSAVTAVVLTWEDLLALLGRPHVGGYLQDRAFALLAARLGDYADRPTLRRKLRNAEREPEEGLLAFPEEQLQLLVGMVPAYAPQITAAWRSRRAWRRRAAYLGGGTALFLLAAVLWLRQPLHASTVDLRVACLQQRVERAGMIEFVHECRADLPDPAGADRVRAEALQRVSLVLEELSNAGTWRSSPGLWYLAARVQREGLVDQVAELADGYEGETRRELLQAQLVLEEVQNL